MARQDKHAFVTLFRELLAVPAPGGREEMLAAIIRKKIEALGYVSETSPSGNLVVRLKGRKANAPTVALAAHMDELAMTVTKIEKDGALRLVPSGGLYPWKLGEAPVEIVGDLGSAMGVLSMGSTHRPNADKTAVTWADVKIVTGMKPESLAAAGVRVGSSAVPAREVRGPYVFGEPDDPMIGAWTFDDRAGCVTLLRLLETLKKRGTKPMCPTLVAFTVHEEGGCHGAKTLCFQEKPEVFISIDGCPVLDEDVLPLDGSVGVWSKDKLTQYDQRLVRDLLDMAAAAGVSARTVVYENAASDASAVYNAGLAPRIGFLGHVRTNSHGFEVARLACFDRHLDVLVKFCETWR